ncbi:tetratricopeptide repeat protein [Virgibacillus doumboii]|uniref:tetratricopeptide repeat protein n=1 Tax=Virgibacillus doumboii TaxID=2697503 RepID=UPI0013DEC208|nr:tetratricopeptide repeat protein [Virgibacillus doumboii]
MLNEQDNVILFPKWRTKLEEESLLALKEKKYEEALTKLDELLSYHVDNHEIIMGKLMCLMELDRYDEAQDLCETLITHKYDGNYYHYVHIYLTILFQTSQYEHLMEQVELEFETGNVPDIILEQFQQLYDMSKEMQNEITYERSSEYISELQEAVNQQNHAEQWRLVERMRQINADPTKTVKPLLTNENVHPVTKTAILKWFKEKNVSDEVAIRKLDTQMTITPVNIPDIRSHPTMKQLVLIIGELEQKDPTLFQIVDKLLYRYIYVRYPVLPDDGEIIHIANALIQLGKEYLDIHTMQNESIENQVTRYMEEIKMCEVLYSTIIES